MADTKPKKEVLGGVSTTGAAGTAAAALVAPTAEPPSGGLEAGAGGVGASVWVS